jgi:spore maturation protein CgeB
MAKTPDEFQNKIEYYLNHPSERIKVANIGQSIVKKYHTSFDRIAQIMHYFNMPQIANLILTKKLEIINV